VLRHRIAADEGSDVDSIIADLRSRLDRTNLPFANRALVTAEVAAVLCQFVDDGRKLAAHGSQFRASREIKGDGYAIQIGFTPLAAKGWLSRLLGR